MDVPLSGGLWLAMNRIGVNGRAGSESFREFVDGQQVLKRRTRREGLCGCRLWIAIAAGGCRHRPQACRWRSLWPLLVDQRISVAT